MNNIGLAVLFLCGLSCGLQEIQKTDTNIRNVEKRLLLAHAKDGTVVKPELIRVVMPLEMQQGVLEASVQAFDEYSDIASHTDDVAKHIQSDLERKYGIYWNCIVGTDSSVTIYTKDRYYMHFKIKGECQLQCLSYRINWEILEYWYTKKEKLKR